jgi:hypothetical protein
VSPCDSCRRSYDRVSRGSETVHLAPRPPMELHLLAANAEQLLAQQLNAYLQEPERMPGHRPQPAASRTHTTCNASTSPWASTDPRLQDHSGTHPLADQLTPTDPTSPATPAHRHHHHHHIMISMQQSPQPFRMSETPDGARCRTSHIATSLSS